MLPVPLLLNLLFTPLIVGGYRSVINIAAVFMCNVLLPPVLLPLLLLLETGSVCSFSHDCCR